MNILFRFSLLCLIVSSALSVQAQEADTGIIPVNVFQATLPDLDDEGKQSFARGRSLFFQVWNAWPSLDTDLDGLGPLYNQPSCGACHVRNGRGRVPDSPDGRLRSSLLRLSLPDGLPHPEYGDQLNDTAVTGIAAEGRVRLHWETHTESFADGEIIELRRPVAELVDLAYGDVGELRMSLRVAPQLVGMGLLDAVPASLLLEMAQAQKPDGISGRVNQVPHPLTGEKSVGRFGWKANVSTLELQTAAAFLGDLGLTSMLFPEENCSKNRPHCLAAVSDSLDVSGAQLQDVVYYQRVLRVPPQRKSNDATGERLFMQAGCQHCHQPVLYTGDSMIAALDHVEFHAYTDLLLHDMGAGLADGRPDHEASATEWRTPPLWGIGLIGRVNGHTQLLHDGRARSVLEALMWHGGEAEASKQRVRNMTRAERERLVEFVESL